METNATGASTPMPRYRCHKEVWALKIAQIVREQMPQFTGALCKGSASLGTACGECERCVWEKEHGPQKTFIVPVEAGFVPLEIDADYLSRHGPQAGGYYVVYKDGYRSFSPAETFEEGYSRI